MIAEFKFGPWLPDVIDYRNPGLEDAVNVLPSPDGYQPALGIGTSDADVGATVLSAAAFLRSDGTRVNVCATAGDLHTIVNGTITNAGLLLTLGEPVMFTRFGASIYATCKTGTWYLNDIETDVSFIAASWTVPKGAVIGRIGDFLFMGDLTDTDASDAPFRIRWSPFNNPQGNWVTSIADQSDAVDMPSVYGRVTGIGPGTTGIIFQKNAISRISYTGGTNVFAKRDIDLERGCIASRSIVTVGDRHYFLAHDGFAFTDGGPSQSISRGRLWRWFIAEAEAAFLADVEGAVDWTNRCILWTIPGAGRTPKGAICFNWETGNWSRIDIAFDVIFASGNDGISLEAMAVTYPNIDTMPISMDSPEFLARGRSVGVFVSGVLSQIAGAPLESVLITGEFQAAPGKRAFVREVTPLITSESTMVMLGGRERTNENVTYSTEAALGPSGFAAVNVDARYIRARFRMPAGTVWYDAYGFQADASVSGAT